MCSSEVLIRPILIVTGPRTFWFVPICPFPYATCLCQSWLLEALLSWNEELLSRLRNLTPLSTIWYQTYFFSERACSGNSTASESLETILICPTSISTLYVAFMFPWRLPTRNLSQSQNHILWGPLDHLIQAAWLQPTFYAALSPLLDSLSKIPFIFRVPDKSNLSWSGTTLLDKVSLLVKVYPTCLSVPHFWYLTFGFPSYLLINFNRMAGATRGFT